MGKGQKDMRGEPIRRRQAKRVAEDGCWCDAR